MLNAERITPTTRQNTDAAIAHLRATATIWTDRKMYGECCVKLRFVDGVAVQWEATQAEVHKTGVDGSLRPA